MQQRIQAALVGLVLACGVGGCGGRIVTLLEPAARQETPHVSAQPLVDGLKAFDRKDYTAAVKLFRLAAEQGDDFAQGMLGVMYADGQGVPQDSAEAVKWYRLAAAQGLASAQGNLGFMYAKGHGMPQDYAEAVKWYRLAAARGNATVQNSLGFMYAEGQGVSQDFVQAHMWFNLAAAQGNANATKNRDLAATKMTPAQIAEAQRLAREWKPTPAK